MGSPGSSRSSSQRAHGFALACALGVAWPWQAFALPVQEALAAVGAIAITQSDSVSVAGPDADLSIAESVSLAGIGDLSVSTHAETHGGVPANAVPPTAVAIVSVGFADADPQNPGGFSFSPEPFASGVLAYSVRVNERKTPPIVFTPPIHVLVRLVGEASVSGPGAGTATANSAFAGIAESARADAQNPNASYDRTFETTLTPGDEVGLSVGVAVELTQFPNETGTLELQAAADPQVEFDQAAFDAYAAQAGFTSFPLADYYELEYSPGIGVPEPAGAALLAAGALVLALARARRREG